MDQTTKLLLLAIALGLFANALGDAIPAAWAADSVSCTISGPIEVRVTSVPDLDARITSFDDEIEVDWNFSAPGSSSSSPLHVKGVQ